MVYDWHTQVLTVVNPKCTYTSSDKHRSRQGVAIVLKELLQLLDKYSIQHIDEPSIRRELRRRSDCKTSGNQFFLTKDSRAKKIIRKMGDTRNISCIIIPYSDIPDSFFKALETGKYYILFGQYQNWKMEWTPIILCGWKRVDPVISNEKKEMLAKWWL